MIGEPMNFVHLTHIGSGDMANEGLPMMKLTLQDQGFTCTISMDSQDGRSPRNEIEMRPRATVEQLPRLVAAPCLLLQVFQAN
uniref:Uncharacterized protein n=1 Tax=Sphaerodactylus townsendi TaxID=933632 RepID=A0ACB8G7Q7_9SAUR